MSTPSTADGSGAEEKRRGEQRADSMDASWSANETANGTSAVSVKQSITPFWDTRIGADMTVARQGTATTSEQLSEKLANGGSLPQSSGTAWAAISAPGVASIWDKTSVEARVDPGSGAEQARHLPEQIAAARRAILADPAERLQPDPAGHRAGARHRQPSGAQPRNRPVGEAQHRRHRHQPDRRPDPVDLGRQMAAQGRRRAEAVRRRHHLRLDRRNAAPAPPTRASAQDSSAAGRPESSI